MTARGRTDNAVTRTAQRLLTTLHRTVLRASGGRLGGRVGGNAVVVLTTTGRSSGKPRPTPLFGYPDGADWVVVASNGGTAGHPQWFRNLQADPIASITVAGRTTEVRAEVLTGAERQRQWKRAAASYSGYDGYQRATDRDIPVVRLVPR